MELRFAPSFSSSVHQLIAVNPHAPYSLFGEYKNRRKLSRKESWAKFEGIWQNGMGNVVETAIADPDHKNLDCKNARAFLSTDEAEYLKESEERRSIEFLGSPFIVQFKRIQHGIAEVDQIWYAHAHDSKQNLICVEFENSEEKDRFNMLARAKGYGSGQALVEGFVRQFMEKDKPRQG